MTGIGSAGNAQSPQHAGALAAMLEISIVRRRVEFPVCSRCSSKKVGRLIASWIGTGQNLPDQLQNVLHGDALQNIVAKSRMD
jgi:hypothetical protein